MHGTYYLKLLDVKHFFSTFYIFAVSDYLVLGSPETFLQVIRSISNLLTVVIESIFACFSSPFPRSVHWRVSLHITLSIRQLDSPLTLLIPINSIVMMTDHISCYFLPLLSLTSHCNKWPEHKQRRTGHQYQRSYHIDRWLQPSRDFIPRIKVSSSLRTLDLTKRNKKRKKFRFGCLQTVINDGHCFRRLLPKRDESMKSWLTQSLAWILQLIHSSPGYIISDIENCTGHWTADITNFLSNTWYTSLVNKEHFNVHYLGCFPVYNSFN